MSLMAETRPELTARQREVVALIAAGCSNEEVGDRLGISPRTAKAHCDVIRQKLGVARRRQIPVAYRSLTGEDPLAQRRTCIPHHRGRDGSVPATAAGCRHALPQRWRACRVAEQTSSARRAV